MKELSKAEQKRRGLIKEVRQLVKEGSNGEELPSDKSLFDNYITYDESVFRNDPIYVLMNYIVNAIDEGAMASGVGEHSYLDNDHAEEGLDINDCDADMFSSLYIFGLDDLEFALRESVQQIIDDLKGSPDSPYHNMSLKKIRFAFNPEDAEASVVRLTKLKTSDIVNMRDKLLQYQEADKQEHERSIVMKVVDKAVETMGFIRVINILTALMAKPGDVFQNPLDGEATVGDPIPDTTDSNQ